MSIQAKRRQIDRIDRALVRLLNFRAALAADLGRLKRSAGLRLRDAQRERRILAHVRRANPGPLDSRAIARLWARILRESRRVESRALRNSHSRLNAAARGRQ